MAPLFKQRIRKKTRTSIAGLFTILIVLIVLLQIFGLRPIYRVYSVTTSIGSFFGTRISRVSTYTSLQKDNTKLQEQLLALAQEEGDRQRLERENEQLRSLLSFAKVPNPYTIHPANILVRSVDIVRAQLLVDAGETDGIEPGMAVIVDDGIIIGTVVNVREHASVVRLLSDQQSRVASKIGKSETIGVSEGTKGTLLDFNFIPQSAEINVNDLVVTSGLEKNIPSGLVIGIATGIAEDDTAPFKSATIEPLIDARHYHTVGIVIVESL